MPSVRGNIYNAAHTWIEANETFNAENTSSGTTEATGSYRAQFKRPDPPRVPAVLIGEVRCLAVEGGFFQARGEITDTLHGTTTRRGFILWATIAASTRPNRTAIM
jgi:hypothetical protein